MSVPPLQSLSLSALAPVHTERPVLMGRVYDFDYLNNPKYASGDLPPASDPTQPTDETLDEIYQIINSFRDRDGRMTREQMPGISERFKREYQATVVGKIRAIGTQRPEDLGTTSDSRRASLIHYMTGFNADDAVRQLLEYGVSPNTTAAAVNQPPIYTAIRYTAIEATRVLFEFGADIEFGRLDKPGNTPLFTALEYNNVPMVRLLVELGAQVDRVDSNGCTPLITASHFGLLEMCRALLELGANPRIRDQDGDSALNVALDRGHTEVAELLRRRAPEMVGVQWLPDSLLVKRERVNHQRGLAAFAWTHKWDRVLNTFRASAGSNSHGRALQAVGEEDDQFGQSLVAVYAFFAPIEDLKEMFAELAGSGLDPIPDGVESIRVQRSYREGAGRCPLNLLLGENAEAGRAGVELLIDRIFKPLGPRARASTASGTVGDSDSKDDDGLGDLNAYAAQAMLNRMVSRLDACLASATMPLGQQKVYRAVTTDRDPDSVVAGLKSRWNATSKEWSTAFVFCSGDDNERKQSCKLLEISIEKGTYGLYLPAVIPRSWDCWEEQEVILPPGLSYELKSIEEYTLDKRGDLDEPNTIFVRAYGGARPSLVSKEGERVWF